MSFGRLHSQTSFFISPILSKKILANSVALPGLFRGGLNYTDQTMDNPYFKFNNKLLSSRPSIYWGIGFGINIDSNKHIFKIELSKDGVGGMAEFSTLSAYNPFPNQIQATHYAHQTFYHQSSHLVSRITLGYNYLLTKKSTKSKVYINSDISLLFGRSHSQVWDYGDINEPGAFVLYNDSEIKKFYYGSQFSGKTLMLGLGLSSDIGFKIHNKWKYFFSLNILYRQGLKTVQSSGYNTYIKDNVENFDSVIYYETSSKGSGIYFEISRRFQLIPWKRKMKRKMKR